MKKDKGLEVLFASGRRIPRMESKKRNWSLIILSVLMFVSIVWWLIPDLSKIISDSANQTMPKKISSSLYKKELKDAKWYASRPGFSEMMEEHLIKADWYAREIGVDISEKVKEIYAMGARSVIGSALTKALYRHTNSANRALITYKTFCLKAEIQPDDKKIAEIKMIIQRNKPAKKRS